MKHILLSLFLFITTSIYSQQLLIPKTHTNSSKTSQNIEDYSRLLYFDNIIDVNDVDIDFDVMSKSEIVTLILDEEAVTFEKKHSFEKQHENYIYCEYESVEADMSISKLGNNVQGILHSKNGTYIIETFGVNSYVLAKVDMDYVPKEALPITIGDSNKFMDIVENNRLNTDSNGISYIRVLVLYTPEAKTLSSNMTNMVYQDINNGNASFINSNINARFELAYLGQISNNEGGLGFHDLLDNFRKNGDGFADEVHSLRERYAADVCVLLVRDTMYCGLGYLDANKDYAFAVVRGSYGCSSKYSFTHEIGHIIGCSHDSIKSNDPYAYGHGYVHYTGDSYYSWRTMMAYSDACGGYDYNCSRIKYWSNPNVYYHGNATGNYSQYNNARVWNENASTVSSFCTDQTALIISNMDNSNNTDYACWRGKQNIISCCGYTVESGQIVEMLSSSIKLLSGTTIKAGAKFRAEIVAQTPNIHYPQFVPSRPNSQAATHNNNKSNVSIKLSDGRLCVNLTLTRECQNVTINIYDILGRLQAIPISNKNMTIGEHSLSCCTNELPKGVFIIVTQIDDTYYTHKITK